MNTCRTYFLVCLALALAACSRQPQETPETEVAPTQTQPATATPAQPTPATGNAMAIPAVPFQQNAGQWADSIAFRVGTFAGSFWITREGKLVHSFVGLPLETDNTIPAQNGATNVRAPSLPRGASAIASPREGDLERGPGWSLVESFRNGQAATVTGRNASPTNVSYFIGDDPSKWAPRVSTFGSVSLGDIWDNIEVELRAGSHNVEKIFHVRPGADVHSIAMTIEGANSVRTGSRGELVVTTGNGDVTWSAPVAYQIIGGVRHDVEVSYAVAGSAYSFRVGSFNAQHELIIDPLLQSTYLGSSGLDAATSPRRASNGDLIIAGFTDGTNFPGTTGGAISVAPGGGAGQFGGKDIVVARINGALTTLIQATYLGGSSSDQTWNRVGIASNGDVYVAGYGNSSDIPGRGVGTSAQFTYGGGPTDIYVFRLNGALTSIIRSTYIGGNQEDNTLGGVAIDASGNIYVSGWSDSANYPGTSGSAQTSLAGGFDAVITRLPSTLASFTKSSYFGTSGYERSWGDPVVNDATGYVYMSLATDSGSLPGSAGTAQTYAGNGDGAVARFPLALTSVISTYFGGSSFDSASGVTISPTGQILVTGRTNSLDFPGRLGGAQTCQHYDCRYGNTDGAAGGAVLSLYSADLSTRIQSTYFGGANQEVIGDNMAAEYTPDGDIIMLVDTISTDIPFSCGGLQPSNAGAFDCALARINPGLTAFRQTTYLGGTAWEQCRGGMVFDSAGNVIVLASTQSTDFPGTGGGIQTANAGGWDMVIARMTADLASGTGCPSPCTTNVDCTTNLRPFCNTSTSTCVRCLSDSQCSDGNPCTTDSCNTGTNVCNTSTSIPGCCTPGAACDDSVTCTSDSCSAPTTNFVTNGTMSGGTATTPPTSWTVVGSSPVGTRTAATNLGFSIPASQNVPTASSTGGNFAYVTRTGTTAGPGMQQTLSGLTVGQRYRVTGQYYMSPGTVTTARSVTTQVRNNAGPTTYTLGRLTQ